MRALWNGAVIAQSEDTILIEGNHYFPPESVDRQYLTDSQTHTTCFWKGEASYYNVVVDGQVNADAAWYYPQPLPGSIKTVKKDFTNFVAFWHGVEVSQ